MSAVCANFKVYGDGYTCMCFTFLQNVTTFMTSYLLFWMTKHFQEKVCSIKKELAPNSLKSDSFNPIALRTAKTLWSFGRSEFKRVKKEIKNENGRVDPIT